MLRALQNLLFVLEPDNSQEIKNQNDEQDGAEDS
jgi:hypothetical protein